MRRKLLYTALVLVLCSGVAGADGVELDSSFIIEQSGTNTTINITSDFNVTGLTAYDTATRIDESNFTANGSTTDNITVNLSFFNKTADLGEYAANFSADTVDGNNVNFSIGLPTGQPYRVYREGTKIKTVSRLSGVLWFNHSSWSSHTFSVKHESNTAPTASFTTGTNDLTVDVDTSGSSDSDGSISTYEWDWTNDGTYDTTGTTASHTYGSDGDYTIGLRVTDDDGATDTTTTTVSVSDSDDGGSGGGGGGGGSTDDTGDEETDEENATDDQTSQPGWTATWQDAIGDTVMTAKRDGTAYINVANEHNRSVNLMFRCVAEADICQYVNVTSDRVTVAASGTETVPVMWTFPDNTSMAPPADPTFAIQITDEASNETATVTVAVVDSLFGPVLPDNFSAPGAARPYLPLLFVPFIGAFAVFVTMRLAQRGKPLSGWDVVIPAAVFMILAVPLAVFILLRVIHA